MRAWLAARLDRTGILVPRAHDDRGSGPLAVHVLGQPEAVVLGHAHIAEDYIGRFCRHHVQRLDRASNMSDGITPGSQHSCQQQANWQLVVDDQDTSQ